MHTFYCGKIEGVNVIAVYSGCGKINAAITVQQLVDKYEVDTIIFLVLLAA
jgi:adenosylhomocysteine nucleosidase